MSEPKRKKIAKLGWGVKWRGGTTEFFATKKEAQVELDYWSDVQAILFRCKIEEVTK